MTKRGKMHIFPSIGKSMHIFSPIDLKFTKLQKKGWQFFNIIHFITRKKYKSRRGGGMHFKFNMHPCYYQVCCNFWQKIWHLYGSFQQNSIMLVGYCWEFSFFPTSPERVLLSRLKTLLVVHAVYWVYHL